MLNFLKKVFKKGELRRKVVFTLGILFVFRLGAGIVIPYIDTSAITSAATSSGIFGIMNMLGGGTLEKFSLFLWGFLLILHLLLLLSYYLWTLSQH